jgi:hypothetical protein
MNGNNTMSKESFARSQAHPRKVELAKILLGESPTKKQDALDSGFNEMIVQEMARDISNNVEGMETFASDLKNGAATEDTPETPETQVDQTQVDESTQTQNDTNQVPNEGTDQIDPNATPEGEVVDQTQVAPVAGEDGEQSTPNQTNPQS